jgi:hypothetical protein
VGAPRQPAQHLGGLLGRVGLAQDRAVERDRRVGGQDPEVAAPRDRDRLGPRDPGDVGLRGLAVLGALVDIGRVDLDGEPDALEQLAAAR